MLPKRFLNEKSNAQMPQVCAADVCCSSKRSANKKNQTNQKASEPNIAETIGKQNKNKKPKTFQRIRKCGMRFSHLPISDSLKSFWFFLFFFVFQWFLLCCDSMPSGCFGFFGFVGFADIPTLLLRAFDNPCSESNSTRLCRHPNQEGSVFFAVFGLPDGFACFLMEAIFGWGEFHVFVILDFVKSVIVACVCVCVCVLESLIVCVCV